MAQASAEQLDLPTFVVRRVAIHEMPKVKRAEHDVAAFAAQLVDDDVALTDQLKDFFYERITTSINRRAYWAIYDAVPQRAPDDDEMDDAGVASAAGRSDVPELIRNYFVAGDPDGFNQLSRELATRLYEWQSGNNSAGLLVLVDGIMGSGRYAGPCLAVLKLEDNQALLVERVTRNGKTTYDASVESVTLPKEAEVFKAAMFFSFRDLAKMRVRLSDKQADPNVWGPGIATFFLRFLGCVLEETADRATLEYYEWIPRFVEEHVSNEADKATVMNQLLSDIDSATGEIDPKKVVKRLPKEYRDDYLNALKLEDGSLNVIQKDTSRLGDRAKNLMYEFDGNIKVWGPREAMEEMFKPEDGRWVLDAERRRLGPAGKK